MCRWYHFSALLILFLLLKTAPVMGATPDQGFLLVLHDPKAGTETHHFVPFSTIRKLPSDSVLTYETVWIGTGLFSLIKDETGLLPEAIEKISVSAPDGYMSVLTGHLLAQAKSALCATQIAGKEVFPPKYGKMRLIFPDLRGMYWVNGPEKIVLTLAGNPDAIHQFSFYFLGGPDSESEKIAVNDLLKSYKLPPEQFYVLAGDGLSREYNVNQALKYLILLPEGDGSWAMDGVNVPTGLKTKQIFFLSGSDKGIFLKPPNSSEQKIWIREFENKQFPDFDLSDFTVQTVMADGNSKNTVAGGSTTICEWLLSIKESQPNLERIDIQW